MKNLANWLFGLVKRSPMLQGALWTVFWLHVGVLIAWWVMWLLHFLPMPPK
jgi:hypothetical protein